MLVPWPLNWKQNTMDIFLVLVIESVSEHPALIVSVCVLTDCCIFGLCCFGVTINDNDDNTR